jgi:hypothetical protein
MRLDEEFSASGFLARGFGRVEWPRSRQELGPLSLWVDA